MADSFFSILSAVDDIYWAYIGFTLLVASGLYLSVRSKFYQIRVLRHLPLTIKKLFEAGKSDAPGLSPFRLYFASIGGMIGLGNIVGVITALLIGGPGALFWLWVAAFAGMIVKYAEIYLGMEYRKKRNGGYEGGTMYALPYAFKGKLGVFLSYLMATLLCIYGVEVYQFTVISDTMVDLLSIGKEMSIFLLLGLVLLIGLGEVKWLANVCTYMMPGFIIVYVVMCLWVIALNITMLPEVFGEVFRGAFVGTAPIGGFVGSTILMAMQQGAARAVYSGDIAIGFDSIIQSESKVLNPQRQARLAIVTTFSDCIICTLSILVVMVSGLWHSTPDLKTSEYVARVLAGYIPYSNFIILVVIFLAGFTTIQAYFTVGLKCAKFLSQKWGKLVYYMFAGFAFWFFAHFEQTQVILIMSLSAGALILINLSCILKMRKEISFDALTEDHFDNEA